MPSNTALPGEIREDDNFTTALYRAAIGPVSTDYYLALFTVWETAGRWRPRWNAAAGLWTLGWLGFRQLGGIALAYAGALVGSLLLLFGLGRLVFDWSETALMGILSLWLATAVLVPGLWGNRWFHQQCRQRMDLALADHTDVAKACAELARQSSPRKRALVIGSVQVGTLLVLGLVASQFAALLHYPALPLSGVNPSLQTASGKVNDLASLTETPSGSVSAPVRPDGLASAPKPPTPTPTPAPTPAPVLALAPSPAARATASASASASTSASTPAVPMVTAKTAVAATSTPRPVASASASLAPVLPVAAPISRPSSGPAPTASLVVPAQTPASAQKAKRPNSSPASATSPPSPVIATSRFGVNVGLFAIESNAKQVQEKLEAAQLTVKVDTLVMKRGPRIRVRVGPYGTLAEAEAAVIQIHGLGLDAIAYAD